MRSCKVISRSYCLNVCQWYKYVSGSQIYFTGRILLTVKSSKLQIATEHMSANKNKYSITYILAPLNNLAARNIRLRHGSLLNITFMRAVIDHEKHWIRPWSSLFIFAPLFKVSYLQTLACRIVITIFCPLNHS